MFEEFVEFHTHLDTCEQCRLHPFNLCAVGGEILAREFKEKVRDESDRISTKPTRPRSR
jgi:hypothetical protein